MPDTTAPQAPLGLDDSVRAYLAAQLADTDPTPQVNGLLALSRPHLKPPCVCVLPLADEAEASRTPPDEAVVQRLTSTVAVIVGVPAPNDPGGRREPVRGQLMELVRQTRAVLLGWPPDGPFPDPFAPDPFPVGSEGDAGLGAEQPAGDARPPGRWTPLTFSRGRLLALDEGRAWWQDEYQASRLMRSEAGVERRVLPRSVCIRLGDEDPVPVVAP